MGPESPGDVLRKEAAYCAIACPRCESRLWRHHQAKTLPNQYPGFCVSKPIGLGARDTLRLEAGMNLYGSDMDEDVTPLESNMASTVFLANRNFIGATALAAQAEAGNHAQLIGLVMQEKGVLRAHYPVHGGGEVIGEITSGAFSPTLSHSIALARVKHIETELAVEIRGKLHPVSQVVPPFVRNGKRVYKPVKS